MPNASLRRTFRVIGGKPQADREIARQGGRELRRDGLQIVSSLIRCTIKGHCYGIRRGGLSFSALGSGQLQVARAQKGNFD